MGLADVASPSLQVLIVDDEVFMRRLIARILGRLNIENISAASSGQEALDMLSGVGPEPDVTLCDLNMPGMDGIEFLRHLADRGYRGDVILVSGEDKRILEAAQALAEAHTLSILGSLAKPITIDGVAELLGRRGGATGRARVQQTQAFSAEDLRRGIDAGQLIPFFQPKIDLRTQRLTGVETLARWRHPKLGLVSPAAFLDLAEREGIIDMLTDAILKQAMSQAGVWMRAGMNLKVAVNISMESVHRLDLPEVIIRMVVDAGMAPSDIIVEVTESKLHSDLAKALEVLTRLRMKGFGLSIDDFGTGYSSMDQLRRFPFTELKIDRAFVHNVRPGTAAHAILESSVDLARRLGMSIVAEGVEDQADWDRVAGFGIDLAQGYFMARPIPGDEVMAWHNKWQTAVA